MAGAAAAAVDGSFGLYNGVAEERLMDSATIVEARLAEQRLVDGKLFPLVLSPSAPFKSTDDALALLKAGRVLLEEKLREHGALFLRGFPLQGPAHFHSVVEALGWHTVPYIGSAPRTQVVGSVYTANDANPDVSIGFHHEMAQIVDTSDWPSKVLFFCETPPSKGGSTPIVMSHKVTEGLWIQCPDFMRKLQEQSLLYLKLLPMETDPFHISLQGWPLVFGTSDRKKAEESAKKFFNAKVEWTPGGSMKMVSGPFKATRNCGRGEGVEAWFNMVMVYHSGLMRDVKVSSEHPYGAVFGDSSPLPQEALDVCKKLHEENSVDMLWQKGDLMIVDNFSVMHGRRSYEPPRQILVSLCR